ncbi:LysR substrate-binding domain-containing protein [Aliiglaciecola sp. LCG003]|uniref:LysR substrate-binding domain-containing protein n=1 Tax=Aliiglaciecola sp. LCG003 TaxID=3053655 RepID=UPI0025730545|nr:LysR substrate-binding domain-containing protein [Aliiglaciecola sp. LCG003]WJG07988.1 LysR substrate-binding domain-containing protein [Aliiglaciecola sp. LCG003]
MKSYLPPLKSLQFFMLAGQLNSFKLAAQKLNVTQAAVSQQIKLLEEQLDLRLFDRNNRQTSLTIAGKRLLPFIEQGFEHFQAGIKAVSGDTKPTILRISAILSFTSLWLLPRIQHFQKLHPELMIQIAPSNDLVNFNSGDIDLAIRMGGGNYAGLTEKKLASDQVILVASPDIIGLDERNQADKVFSLPWLEDTTRVIQPIFAKLCEQYGIAQHQMTFILRANNSVTLIENAVAGRGFTIVNKSLVADHLLSGKLVKLLNYSQPSPFSLYLVAPENHFQWPKIKLFEDWFIPQLEQTFVDLDRW